MLIVSEANDRKSTHSNKKEEYVTILKVSPDYAFFRSVNSMLKIERKIASSGHSLIMTVYLNFRTQNFSYDHLSLKLPTRKLCDGVACMSTSTLL